MIWITQVSSEFRNTDNSKVINFVEFFLYKKVGSIEVFDIDTSVFILPVNSKSGNT